MRCCRNERSPKIVYNLMFSMPAGTPPQKVLAATKKFGTEKFAGGHRYAMVLHTDQKYPHVHMGERDQLIKKLIAKTLEIFLPPRWPT